MLSRGSTALSYATPFGGIFFAAVMAFAAPPRGTTNDSPAVAATDKTGKTDNEKRVTVKVARERARLAHDIFSSTLDVMHHRYFRDDRATVPAKALEEVFAEIALRQKVKANWISVNTEPMSINHRPQDDFEKQAARAIASGKEEFERVEKGTYRRAGAISLMNRGCLSCHLRFTASAKTQRFAGLVITIPVTGQ